MDQEYQAVQFYLRDLFHLLDHVVRGQIVGLVDRVDLLDLFISRKKQFKHNLFKHGIYPLILKHLDLLDVQFHPRDPT